MTALFSKPKAPKPNPQIIAAQQRTADVLEERASKERREKSSRLRLIAANRSGAQGLLSGSERGVTTKLGGAGSAAYNG